MRFLPFIAFLSIPLIVFSQHGQRQSGPIIEGYGATFQVDDPEFETDPSIEYKVVFDIHARPRDPSAINPMLNTLARFLNMHAAAGVPAENLHVACVIHNEASVCALNDEAYNKKFGLENPNVPLMEALAEAGADIYMCGQSVYARGLERDQLASPVKVGLSAMTVILTLEQQGYQLIKF